jgi:hypothetical protein
VGSLIPIITGLSLTSLPVQARAARLSFADVVKRLAATPEGQPTFVSKKARSLPATLLLPCLALVARRGYPRGQGCALPHAPCAWVLLDAHAQHSLLGTRVHGTLSCSSCCHADG